MSAWYILTALGFYPVNAASGDFDLGEDGISRKGSRNLNGQRTRIGPRLLRRRQRAVALELGQIGTVGRLHLPELRRQSFGRERPSRDRAQLRRERRHGS